ncbi:MAG: hypothetical protein HOY71_23925, partial [Nonomuraea sp.]|nr:hypothetical protein [Nonomuraea sp.]
RKTLEFSDFDVYYDQNSTASRYHTRQVLVDGQVAWESEEPGSGGEWHRHTVDLTQALRGKTSAKLAIRLLDKTSLSLWTGVYVDDVKGDGLRVGNGGFERRDGWTVSGNSAAITPEILHAADFLPANALQAATQAFRGEPYRQSPSQGHHESGNAMYGTGRLSLSVSPFTQTPPGACAKASQVLDVDPASPRYEVDFFQTSPHTPYPGFNGAHQLTVRVDDQPVWTRDANSVYPFWENGNGLQGPIDVTDFVKGKRQVTLSFQLCGLQHADPRPNPPIDVGFDNLRTVGLSGHEFGFEGSAGWRFSSDSDALSARVVRPATRPEAPAVSLKAGQAVVREGTTATIPVTVANSGGSPVTVPVGAEVPQGWSAQPVQATVPAGGSATVEVKLQVPATAALGSYWIVYSAGEARYSGRVQIIGDTIEFTPGTAAEAPWLAEPDGSQLDGPIFDGHGRFADGTTYFTYRFDIPADVTGGSLTVHIGNEFVVRVSPDGQTWRTIATEEREIHNLSNLADRTFDLADVRQSGKPLFVRVEDAKTDDGWGGWLGHLKLAMTSR